MSHKFYQLEHGWANRYYWFDITNELPVGKRDFEKRIKKSKLTFSKQSGTTPADIHGSTMAIKFYSQRFVDFLEKSGIKNFYKYKIKFVQEMNRIGNYYYLEFKDQLLGKKTELYEVIFDTKIRTDKVTFYLEDWKGQDIFSIKGTRIVVVTERLKKLIDKAKLKNIQFEEVKPSHRFLSRWFKK